MMINAEIRGEVGRRTVDVSSFIWLLSIWQQHLWSGRILLLWCGWV